MRPASPDFPQTRLAAAECRHPLGTFTGNKSFQSSVYDSSLLLDTAELCRLLEKVVVDV
jgi:hypothetical protein